VDIRNPSEPAVVGTSPLGLQDLIVERSGQPYLLSSWGASLHWYGLVDPVHPTHLGTMTAPPDDYYSWLADDGGVLYVRDYLTNARQEYVIAMYGFDGSALSLQGQVGHHVYDFLGHDGKLYWTQYENDGFRYLHVRTHDGNETLVPSPVGSALDLWATADEVFVDSDDYLSGLQYYDPDANALVPVQVPDVPRWCRVVAAGERHLLCSTGDVLYAYRIMAD
jgi:hypothetical protein